ncbi:MAG TPA: zinc dependent phospholipase C family protein [Chryseosolibacter sp.]
MWGFFGHQKINRLAVFTLPPEMIGFYKKNITYITEASVNPDKRRYAVVDEAPRHYLDLDHYGDSALFKMPRYWKAAVEKYSEDTLKAYGIVPWHIERMQNRLRDAFMIRDPDQILKVSAEIGHYIADAHVPLHTTENYNGQLTGQEGIHGFWESRLPELFSENYNFFVGKAEYISNTQLEAWKAITLAHSALDSVLTFERELTRKFGERKFSFETRGKLTQKNYSREFAKAYHNALSGMVERHMRICIRRIGSFWYTAWVDAGQPDLKSLLEHKPTEQELAQRRAELEEWKKAQFAARPHE